MTNKRASEILYHQWQSFLEKNLDYGGVSEGYKKAFKALQQEPILDKIKDEIDTQDKWLAQAGYTAYNVDIAFNSIKRVLAESEE